MKMAPVGTSVLMSKSVAEIIRAKNSLCASYNGNPWGRAW